MKSATIISILTFFLIGPVTALHAAEGDTLWTRTFGGPFDEEAYSVQQTTDGGFILAGYTDSFGAGYWDAFLVKTNASGDTLWTRTFGGDSYDWAQSVQQTLDGGYILAGTSGSYSPEYNDEVYAIKTDSVGRPQWMHTYGGQYNCYGYCARQTPDGGYIIVGDRGMAVSGNTDLFLIKTNSNGDTLWTKTIGSTSYDCGYCIEPISNGYIITGARRTLDPYYDDVYLVKCDNSGNVIWEKFYGGTGDDEGLCVQQTGDGGFIVAGYFRSVSTNSKEAWLLKTDSSGDTLWTRTFGDTSGSDEFSSVDQTQDSGYVLVGTTTSWGDIYGNLYLVKTNGSGDLLWYRTYGEEGHNEDGYCIQQISDGNYVIAGETTDLGPDGYNAWLLYVEGPASGIEPLPQIKLLQPAFFVPHPNPFNPTSVASFDLPVAGHVGLRVYDTAGRLVTTLVEGWRPAGIHEATFDGRNLPSGIYLARLTVGDFQRTQKLVLLK
jgi:hypothetical protein